MLGAGAALLTLDQVSKSSADRRLPLAGLLPGVPGNGPELLSAAKPPLPPLGVRLPPFGVAPPPLLPAVRDIILLLNNCVSRPGPALRAKALLKLSTWDCRSKKRMKKKSYHLNSAAMQVTCPMIPPRDDASINGTGCYCLCWLSGKETCCPMASWACNTFAAHCSESSAALLLVSSITATLLSSALPADKPLAPAQTFLHGALLRNPAATSCDASCYICPPFPS